MLYWLNEADARRRSAGCIIEYRTGWDIPSGVLSVLVVDCETWIGAVRAAQSFVRGSFLHVPHTGLERARPENLKKRDQVCKRPYLYADLFVI